MKDMSYYCAASGASTLISRQRSFNVGGALYQAHPTASSGHSDRIAATTTIRAELVPWMRFGTTCMAYLWHYWTHLTYRRICVWFQVVFGGNLRASSLDSMQRTSKLWLGAGQIHHFTSKRSVRG